MNSLELGLIGNGGFCALLDEHAEVVWCGTQPAERSLASFNGFRGSVPVRVGNDASKQHQHDVYGAVVLAAAQRFFDTRIEQPGDEVLFRRLEIHGDIALDLYHQPDAGLWERRDVQSVSTYSSVMCRAACDRLAHIARCLALAALGRRDEARAVIEKMPGHRPHLGLLSEHIDPSNGELWGNFPQTYSMLGIFQPALRLSTSRGEAL
ncbi:MAG: hypothetical protein KGL00_02535 [Gammaproteobacteria bacterium]|nr:hypothetical protein [Gammaproteobacteria bacterium]MDE2273048.1 hypothetical protein [Gammaproteobacteria bacterium]